MLYILFIGFIFYVNKNFTLHNRLIVPLLTPLSLTRSCWLILCLSMNLILLLRGRLKVHINKQNIKLEKLVIFLWNLVFLVIPTSC